MSSSTAYYTHLHDRDVQSNDGTEHKDEDQWSGDDQDSEDGGPRKRKSAKTSGPSGPMSVSCELCKNRKVKCDRGHPQCGWCVRNGQICEYKERRKPGLRAGYGRALEARLDKLEGVLETHQHILQRLTASEIEVGAAANGPVSTNVRSNQDLTTRSLPQYTGLAGMCSTPGSDARVSDGTPQLSNEMSQQQASNFLRHASQSSLSGPRFRSGNVYAPSDPPVQSPSLNIARAPEAYSVKHNSIPSTVFYDADLPPYDLLYALTELFFQHINTWCPILYRRTTLDTLFGPTPLEEADCILLHAIVATTLRFSIDPRLNEALRERYYNTSKQKVLLYGLENSSVKALQALVVLALDITGSSNGPPGWNVLALITRSAVQLGLAVETTSASIAPLYPSIYTLRAMVLPESESFIEEESRRRLFWVVYLLDRYATVATAFEFALDERDIDRRLPCHDELFSRNQPVETRWFQTTERRDYSMDKPENLGSFSYYVEIVGVLSRIHRFLKKPVDIGALNDVEKWQQEYRELDSRLSAWRYDLPGEYGDTSRLFSYDLVDRAPNCGWVMLHATYHTTVIRLHSSAAYPTMRSAIFSPSLVASQRCLKAAEDIALLCTYVQTNSLLDKLGPPFAFSLWVAARLLLVHGSTIDHRVSPKIFPLVDALRNMGRYWKVSERYATLLQRVLDEYHDSESVAIDTGVVRETPSTVAILADMRRCAYDLDFLISAQPRQLPSEKSNAATRARTLAPNDLEYLDVFDFFNVPRLPPSRTSDLNMGAMGPDNGMAAQYGTSGTETNNQCNIVDFAYDASADWVMNAIQ